MGRSVLCGLLLFAAGPAFGQTTLTWKWTPDDKPFYVTTVSNVRQTLKLKEVGGQDSGREVGQEFQHVTRLRYQVRKVDSKGNAEIEQTVQQVSITSKLPLEDVAITRADDSLKDAKLILHVTPRGEVTKVEGVKELLDKLAGSDIGKRKRAVLAAALSEDTLKQQASQAFGFLPDKPLKAGLSWQRPAGVAFGPLGQLLAERTYTYDGKSSGKGPVKITFTTEVKEGFEPGKAGPAGLLVTRGKFKAVKGKGSLEFDAAKGRLIKADSGLKLEGEITFKDPNSETEFTGQLTQEQAIKTTVKDKE